VTQPLDWDTVYVADGPPPWDIGRPQPEFVRLAGAGMLRGGLLDAGCGTGENALLAAAHGADAVGVDVSPTAIARARAKAAERGLKARFEVGDALNLGQLGLSFGTVIDSGLFHVFDDADRERYVASLASVLRPGGTCYLMCFSELQEGTLGPAGCARTRSSPRSATGGGFLISPRRSSRSTPGSATGLPHVPGWPRSAASDLTGTAAALVWHARRRGPAWQPWWRRRMR
jgi:SAM-dependent methyltransferase